MGVLLRHWGWTILARIDANVPAPANAAAWPAHSSRAHTAAALPLRFYACPVEAHEQPIACRLALAIATALAGCATSPPATKTEAPMPATAYSGVFATPSTLDLNYPRFDQIKDSDFAPAFDAGMAEQLREIDAIANNPEPPTFQNTIVAMEKSGQLLDRASNVFFNLVGTDKNDARDKLQSDYAPKFSAHRDAITLNPKLFARIKALHDARATPGAGRGRPAPAGTPPRGLRARRRGAHRCAEGAHPRDQYRDVRSAPVQPERAGGGERPRRWSWTTARSSRA